MARLPVKKTYKLFVGGEFPRSESGRTYEAQGAECRPRLAQGRSRRRQGSARGASGLGRRDRVQPRPGALPPGRDDGGAHGRPRGGLLGQEGGRGSDRSRRLVRGLGRQARAGRRFSNPVAGPYFNFTVPEPTGVVAILAPDEPALGGLVSRVAPALVGGNAVVVLASETQPLAAIELAEAIATSDVPAASSTCSPARGRRSRRSSPATWT